MNLRFVIGDATDPQGDGQKIIVHVCNDAGKWGKGFVLALSRRWPEPEREYRAGFASATPPGLGDVQVVRVSEDVSVANVIGQHGVRRQRGSCSPPIRYDAVRAGLEKVAEQAKRLSASVHMPRIGCGLAGGRWDMVEPIIKETLTASGLSTTVYDLEEARAARR